VGRPRRFIGVEAVEGEIEVFDRCLELDLLFFSSSHRSHHLLRRK